MVVVVTTAGLPNNSNGDRGDRGDRGGGGGGGGTISPGRAGGNSDEAPRCRGQLRRGLVPPVRTPAGVKAVCLPRRGVPAAAYGGRGGAGGRWRVFPVQKVAFRLSDFRR